MNKFLVSTLFFLYALPIQIYAATPWGGCLESDNKGGTDIATIECLIPLFKNIISTISVFVGVVLFVVLIVSGFTYLTAGSDPKRMEKAKGALSGALMGLVVVVLAYLIIRLISIFTGVESIENFNLNFGQ